MIAEDDTASLKHSRRWWVGLEILVVLGVSFGRSALSALLSLIEKLQRDEPLAQQTTNMNNAQADQSMLDLAYQLYSFILPLAAVGMVWLLLRQQHADVGATVGFNRRQPAKDIARGALIAAGVGVPGLIFYFVARAIGINTTVAPANLNAVWWAVPILLLSALMAGLSEEMIMIGYLLTRWRDLGWRWGVAISCSALIRGGYHLYQGFGGFFANLVMGLVFGWLYWRWRRVAPLVIAHFLMDATVFVGYPLLAPHLSWLLAPG
jgi:membrane protease YdiL (CAAX protease family)